MVEAGARLNIYSLTSNTYPELRLQSSLKLFDGFMLKASFGIYHQFANKIALLKNKEYFSAWVISDNSTFPVVSSNNTMFGMNYSINPSTNIDIEFYNKYAKNLTNIFDYYIEGPNNKLTEVRRYLHGDDNVDGMDVLLRKSFGNYHLWVAYTLSKSMVQYAKVNNGQSYQANDNQLHELKVFNMYKLQNWTFSLTGIYGSGKNWDDAEIIPKLRNIRDYHLDPYGLPPYYRVDCGSSYSLHLKSSVVKMGINFFNLFDTKNTKSRVQKLSDNFVENIQTGQSALDVNNVYGLGFATNFFINLTF
jgi:hypothetical protein